MSAYDTESWASSGYGPGTDPRLIPHRYWNSAGPQSGQFGADDQAVAEVLEWIGVGALEPDDPEFDPWVAPPRPTLRTTCGEWADPISWGDEIATPWAENSDWGRSETDLPQVGRHYATGQVGHRVAVCWICGVQFVAPGSRGGVPRKCPSHATVKLPRRPMIDLEEL